MVKKIRDRRDQYYRLARESGYRSRAAFKLLQLDSKLSILSKARCVVDLCAAPGGWLQAAQERMPGGSLIIGVDLVPIRPINGVITLQGDITTSECRNAILKQMTGWLADVVLHDGSPNIGGNWPREAFDQNCLVLSALKLAASILKRGGSFVTKVFRSQDYTALLGVFRKVFTKVQATKPAASRSESAEIFVVCMNYQPIRGEAAAELFDQAKVFEATSAVQGSQMVPVRSGEAAAAAVLRERKRLRRTHEGYDDKVAGKGAYLPLSAVTFVTCRDGTHAKMIAESNSINLDDPRLAEHPLTTAEIRECCRDVRVLGRRELRLLLAWRRKMGKLLSRDKKKDEPEDAENKEAEKVEVVVDEAEEEERRTEAQIQALKQAEDHRMKKKLKKARESKLAARKRMTAAPEAAKFRSAHDLLLEEGGETELFSLNTLRSMSDLAATLDVDATELATDVEEPDSEDEDFGPRKRRKTVAYRRDEDREYEDDELMRNIPDQDAAPDKKAIKKAARAEKKNAKNAKKKQAENDDDDGDDEELEMDDDVGECPLEASLEPVNERDVRCVKLWENTVSTYLKGEKPASDSSKKKQGKRNRKESSSSEDESDDEADSGNELDEWELEAMARIKGKGRLPATEITAPEKPSDADKKKEAQQNQKNQIKKKQVKFDVDSDDTDSDLDDVKPNTKPGVKMDLDPVSLALGAKLINSQKSRRELIEAGYNRYAFGTAEEIANLPNWFADNEKQHNQPNLPVSREEITLYKDRLRALDARPIHKVAEARGRKKRRQQGKIDAARKEAEKLAANEALTDAERQAALKRVYRAARSSVRKENRVQVVVARGKATTKRTVRPPGVKGRYKVVDGRMKKDMRSQKRAEKRSGGNKKRR